MNDRYTELYSTFQWLIPTHFNIAEACLHQWAQNPYKGRRPALLIESDADHTETRSFNFLAETSNRLANGLIKIGIRPGDRVAIAMGQRPETIAAFMAVFSAGAIAIPLSAAFDASQAAACLKDARCRVVIGDTASGPLLLEVQRSYPELTHLIGLGFQHDTVMPWRTLLARQPGTFTPLATTANTPALLLYHPHNTLGAVLPHKALIGNLPGFVASQNWFPQANAVFWTSADWCDPHGLLNALLPTLYFGMPLLATLGQPAAKALMALLARYQVSNAYFDHALLQQIEAGNTPNSPGIHLAQAMRAIAVPADAASDAHFQWCKSHLGIEPNTVFGQIEINQYLAGSLHQWGSQAATLGRAVPGHRVAILDSKGRPCPHGQTGRLAIHRLDETAYPDPALFLGYWAKPDASEACFSNDWFLTPCFGTIDADGFFRLSASSSSTGTPQQS